MNLPFEVGEPLKKRTGDSWDDNVYESGWTMVGYDHWWGYGSGAAPIYAHEDGRTTSDGSYIRDVQ